MDWSPPTLPALVPGCQVGEAIDEEQCKIGMIPRCDAKWSGVDPRWLWSAALAPCSTMERARSGWSHCDASGAESILGCRVGSVLDEEL